MYQHTSQYKSFGVAQEHGEYTFDCYTLLIHTSQTLGTLLLLKLLTCLCIISTPFEAKGAQKIILKNSKLQKFATCTYALLKVAPFGDASLHIQNSDQI